MRKKSEKKLPPPGYVWLEDVSSLEWFKRIYSYSWLLQASRGGRLDKFAKPGKPATKRPGLQGTGSRDTRQIAIAKEVVAGLRRELSA